MSGSQDARMAAILLRLEMLSHGSTQAWNPSGGQSGEPDDKTVSQVQKAENPPHIRWRIIYGKQATDEGREAVIKDAQAELDSWVGRTEEVRLKQAQATQSDVDVILEAGKGWDPESVARRFGVAPNWVRRRRTERDLGAEDGMPLLPELLLPGPGDKPTRARELCAQGKSTRQVAEILEVHQTQVMRWIRKG